MSYRLAASQERSRRLKTALLLGLGGMLLLHVWLFFTWRQEIVEGYPDFISFYTGGKMVLQGLGNRLYDPHTQEMVQSLAAARVQYRQGPLLYNHPPFEALLFVPFAMVSYVTAYVLWTIVNLFLLCGSAVLLWPYLANLRRLSPAVAVLLIFSSFPVFVSILQGQDSILLLAIFAASFVALKRNRAEIAGLLLALGTFKFQVVIPVMAIFLLQRRWKLATGFLVGVAGLVGMSATVVGWRTMLAYPRLLHHIEHGLVGVTPRVMPNIRGLVASLHGGSGWFATVIVIVASGMLVLVAGFIPREVDQVRETFASEPQVRFDLAFSFSMIIALLVSYHLNPHDLSLLVLPVLLVFEHIAAGDIAGRPAIVLQIAIAALLCSPLYLALWLHFNAVFLMACPIGLLAIGLAAALLQQKAAPTARAALA